MDRSSAPWFINRYNWELGKDNPEKLCAMSFEL